MVIEEDFSYMYFTDGVIIPLELIKRAKLRNIRKYLSCEKGSNDLLIEWSITNRGDNYPNMPIKY